MNQPPGGAPEPPFELPQGDPVYVPQAYPHQPQYYPPQAYPHQPQYYPPQAYPPLPRHSAPVLGWLLFAVGVLIAVSSLLPWAVLFGISVDGTDGDGTLTVFGAVVISATGLLIGLRQGALWTSITAFCVALFVILVALIDIANIKTLVGQTTVFDVAGAVTVGPGLWLTLIGGLLGGAISLIAMVRR